MKIAVFGAGGVGAYYGAKLALAGAEVHLIARGAHLEALHSGLKVPSVGGDFEATLPATDDPELIGPSDLVLFCVKSYDTEEAAGQLRSLLDDQTTVLTLQNGVDNHEKIGAVIGPDSVLPGVAYILSSISEPGVVEHTGGPATIAFGELDGSESDRSIAVLEIASRAGIASRIERNIRRTLWEKFIFICAQAGTTALTRLPIGDIRRIPETYELYRELLRETAEVGRAEGVDIPANAVETILGFTENLPSGALSSMHYDLTHGKRMELDALHGTVLRLGTKHGLDVPATRTVYATLKPWAVAASENV